MNFIERLEIDGFHFRETSLELRPLNVVIGPNGAGKSTLLQAISIMATLARKHDPRFTTLEPHRPDDPQQATTIAVHDAQGATLHAISNVALQNRYIKREQDTPASLAKLLAPWAIHDFAQVGYAPYQETRNARRISPNGLNLPSHLVHLAQHQPKRLDYIRRQFRRFVNHDAPDHRNVKQLSPSSARILALICLLAHHDANPGPIALEHPENGVSQSFITVLAAWLKSISTHSQVFVTTHSPKLVDQFCPEDLVIVEDNPQPSARRLTGHQAANLQIWLEEETLGNLWTRNFIGGRP